jgi:hypothetical protein
MMVVLLMIRLVRLEHGGDAATAREARDRTARRKH